MFSETSNTEGDESEGEFNARTQWDLMPSIIEPSGSRALTPPRGAAIAGVIFSLLMIVSLGLVRYTVPADLSVSNRWLAEPERRNAILLALDLVPFAGIAFLWFMGVLRNRLGENEDQFFATVFFASGLLFVASLFCTAAALRALVESVAGANIGNDIYQFAYRVSAAMFNLFAIKMAGVFMFSTCTIGLRTAIIQRWVALTGYAAGVLLLVIIANWKWITLVFPIWILMMSTQILLSELRSRDLPAPDEFVSRKAPS
jgi:hypothetical protein